MKGYEEPTTTFIEILTIIIFTLFIFGSLITMTRFKTEIKNANERRIAIDFGENVISANCLADSKGVLNETKLNQELQYSKNTEKDSEEKDGLSCIATGFLAKIMIFVKDENEEKVFEFGRADNPQSRFRFPAIIKKENGKTLPCVVVVEVEIPK